MNGIAKRIGITGACAWMCAVTGLGGTVRQWAGPAQGGVWHAAGNWSPVGIPEADDAVTLTGAVTVTLAGPTAALASFAVESGATLLFSNSTATATWLYATSVTVRVGGNLSHARWPETLDIPGAVDRHAVRVEAQTVSITDGAAIDVGGRGYPGRGSKLPHGWGPGAGSDPLWREGYGHSSGGGGHGGRGGQGYTGFAGRGGVYGDPAHPLLAGSSACGGGSGTGGGGGGVVHIVADSVNLNATGAIRAHGGDGSGSHGGGGSGGSILIACDTIAGSGTLAVQGGNRGGEGGQGGGGRIAVHFDPVAQTAVTPSATLTFNVRQGANNISSYPLKGEYGSLYVTSQLLLGANPLPRLSFETATGGEGSQTMGAVKIHSADAFVLPGLTLGANQRIGFVEIPGGVRIEGDVTLATRSEFYIETSGDPVTVTGDVTLSGNPSIFEYGILRLAAPDALPDPSLAATNLHVQGGFAVQNGGKLRTLPTVATNAGVVRVVCDGLIDVAAGGEFSAIATGYAGSSGVGYGYGPGRGYRDGTGGSGGGHGGQGGRGYNSSNPGGETNGVPHFPLLAGSGGGGNLAITDGIYSTATSAGGGALWIQAGAVRNNGLISANAANRSVNARSAGGAGGSLLIQADRFETGTGVYSANGGNGGQHAGGGGGGRVALRDWTAFHFEGPISVSGGAVGTSPGSATAGALGSIHVAPLEIPGGRDLTVIGHPAALGEWTPYTYGRHHLAEGVYTNTVTEVTAAVGGARNRFITWVLTNETGVVATDTTLEVEIDLAADGTALLAFWTNQWALTVSASLGGTVPDNPAGWYDHGETVEMSATADSGYLFITWAGSGVPEGMATANPLTVTMDRARELQAIFASETPTAREWTGGAGNWTDSAKWSPAGAPGPNDTLTITNGTVTLSDAMQVKALTIVQGGTLVMHGWETMLTLSGDLIVDAGGELTHTPCGTDDDPVHRVQIDALNIEVREGGQVNVDGRGYLGGECVVAGTPVDGYGPGGGGVNASAFGGAHGGFGVNNHGGTPPNPYGSAVMPLLPGSGGGSGIAFTGLGGSGGGVIRLTATDAMIIDGVLTADGGDATGAGHPGGGAGGSIYLVGQTLEGGGFISAGGGQRSGEGGGGGGGRIAVHYDTNAQAQLVEPPAVTFRQVVYANGIVGRFRPTLEQGGSLWLSDNQLFDGTLANWLEGVVQYATEIDLALPALVADGARIKLAATHATLDVAGAVTITNAGEIGFAQAGRLTVGTGMTVGGTHSALRVGTFDGDNGGSVTVAGDLAVSNAGTVSFRYPANAPGAFDVAGTFVFSGTGNLIELIAAPTADPTNAPGGLLDWSVKDLVIPDGATLRLVSDGVSGGSVWLKFRDLTVAAGGLIDADGAGYWGGWIEHRDGYGVGGGSRGANSGGGGGYGGAGGKGAHSDSYPGGAYGNEQHPDLPGSGGAVGGSSGAAWPVRLAGGGGLIRIESRSLTVDGILSANGAYAPGSHSGGGSGGGIYIRTGVLAGGPDGLLRANGRDAPSVEAGAGGGGRIAVWSRRNDWVDHEDRVEVLRGETGANASSMPGDPGTVYWGVIPASGTVILLR